MKIIRTRLKHEFGNERYYPVNEEARSACSLGGCKSLTQKQLRCLKSLGFKIEIEVVTEVKEEVEIKELE